MPYLGTIVDFSAILICGSLGYLARNIIPKRITNAIVLAMSVFAIYIGIEGALEPIPVANEGAFLDASLMKIIVMIISMALGTFLGELIDIEKWIERFGLFIERKLTKNPAQEGGFARGFVTCTLLFCVGAMAVNGAIQDAAGEPDLLFAKAMIDGIMCFVLTTTLGIGCIFSAFPILIYQGLLTLFATFIFANLPAEMLGYMSATGSLIIFFIGTNQLGVTKLRTANMVPAIFMPLAIAPLLSLIA